MQSVFKKKNRVVLFPMNLQYFAEGDGSGEDTGKDDQKSKDNNAGKDNNTDHEAEKQKAVEEAKKIGVSEFMKSLGVNTEEDLLSIVQKHKADEEKNLTDIQKITKEKDEALRQCAEANEARIMAEAQLEALKIGARPELVEDIVLIAKTKVTKDKDVKSVLEEMKKGSAGKVYFQSENDDKGAKKQNKRVVTRKAEDDTREDDNTGGEDEGAGFASRLLSGRMKKAKSSYWD